MNPVDTLYHFTTFSVLKTIINEGFKPSFSVENLGEKNILIPMVSFSNILLRDIGNHEVIDYGKFALGFSRAWAIRENINPVLYSFNNGETVNAIKAYLDNSVLISKIKHYKEHLKKISENHCGPLSNKIGFTNTSTESKDLIDFLSVNYNENLVDILSRYALANYDHTKSLIYLTKPYRVENKEGKMFIAYNDREWRKTYLKINYIIEDEEAYQTTIEKAKPHFLEEEYRLKFELKDISVIVVEQESNISEVKNCLVDRFTSGEVEKSLNSNEIRINTREKLIEQGY